MWVIYFKSWPCSPSYWQSKINVNLERGEETLSTWRFGPGDCKKNSLWERKRLLPPPPVADSLSCQESTKPGNMVPASSKNDKKQPQGRWGLHPSKCMLFHVIFVIEKNEWDSVGPGLSKWEGEVNWVGQEAIVRGPINCEGSPRCNKPKIKCVPMRVDAWVGIAYLALRRCLWRKCRQVRELRRGKGRHTRGRESGEHQIRVGVRAFLNIPRGGL